MPQHWVNSLLLQTINFYNVELNSYILSTFKETNTLSTQD